MHKYNQGLSNDHGLVKSCMSEQVWPTKQARAYSAVGGELFIAGLSNSEVLPLFDLLNLTIVY